MSLYERLGVTDGVGLATSAPSRARDIIQNLQNKMKAEFPAGQDAAGPAEGAAAGRAQLPAPGPRSLSVRLRFSAVDGVTWPSWPRKSLSCPGRGPWLVSHLHKPCGVSC